MFCNNSECPYEIGMCDGECGCDGVFFAESPCRYCKLEYCACIGETWDAG